MDFAPAAPTRSHPQGLRPFDPERGASRVRWGLVAQFPAPLGKSTGRSPCFSGARGTARAAPTTRTHPRTPAPPTPQAQGGRRGSAPGDGTGRGGGGEEKSPRRPGIRQQPSGSTPPSPGQFHLDARVARVRRVVRRPGLVDALGSLGGPQDERQDHRDDDVQHERGQADVADLTDAGDLRRRAAEVLLRRAWRRRTRRSCRRSCRPPSRRAAPSGGTSG